MLSRFLSTLSNYEAGLKLSLGDRLAYWNYCSESGVPHLPPQLSLIFITQSSDEVGRVAHARFQTDELRLTFRPTAQMLQRLNV